MRVDGIVDIDHGGTVSSAACYLGARTGVVSTISVSNAGRWSARNLYLGNTVNGAGSGNLSVTDGGRVNSNGSVYLGYSSLSTGTATVTGADSELTANQLYVGYSGTGNLSIANGGTVEVSGETRIKHNFGTLDFGDGAGTLTTKTLWASPTDLAGRGTINARGIVSDVDLTFDSPHGANHTFLLNGQPDQNVTVNLDMSNPTNPGDLGVGYMARGSLTIQGGTTVNSYKGYLGYTTSGVGSGMVTGTNSKWTNQGSLYIGYSGNGDLTIDDHGTVSNSNGYIGYSSNSINTATVNGDGTNWINSGDLYVGYSGNGILNITNGGNVDVNGTTYCCGPSTEIKGSGYINFGTNGGTLTTKTLIAPTTNLSGTGTIAARGFVSDMDLLFDSNHGASQTLLLDSLPDQHVKVNLDMSDPTDVGDLGIGEWNHASLTIRDGVTVYSQSGAVGSRFHARARIEGADSTWTNFGDLYIGEAAEGMMTICNGGTVNSTNGYIGMRLGSDSMGRVIVDGNNSKWNSDTLNVVGMLQITGGGTVNTTYISITGPQYQAPLGRLYMDIGNGSQLVVEGDRNSFQHAGEVRLFAGAKALSGSYSPISSNSWYENGGTYQALGGTWDPVTHEFTVSDAARAVPTAAGMSAAINLKYTQRVLIDDEIGANPTGWTVGASFLASDADKMLNMSAWVMHDSAPSGLAEGESILGAWNFAFSSGYDEGDPAYLSFLVGGGYSRDDFRIWRLDGNAWSAFDAVDLSYDGQYANFTVTSFSGYAVTGIMVPEPETLSMLLAVGMGMLLAHRRNRRSF
jgi:T5SS/PEP-CTERM-associated repeat protein